MPNYKGHLAGGAIMYALIVIFCIPTITAATFFEWICFVFAGALFPDIDTKSKGQRLFFGLLFFIMIILILQQKFHAAGLLALASCIPLLVHHRGIFHNLFFLTLFIAVVGFFVATLMPQYKNIIMYDTLFFWVGVFSHIVLDRGIRRLI